MRRPDTGQTGDARETALVNSLHQAQRVSRRVIILPGCAEIPGGPALQRSSCSGAADSDRLSSEMPSESLSPQPEVVCMYRYQVVDDYGGHVEGDKRRCP